MRHIRKRKFGLSNGKVGAISELMVSVDLMKKGFEVYRAVSIHSSSDLVAIKNGKKITLEVRTASYKSQNRPTIVFDEYKDKVEPAFVSNLSYCKKPMSSDNYALVTFVDDKVHYEPELAI